MDINTQLNNKYKKELACLIIKDEGNYLYLDNIVVRNKGNGVGNNILDDLIKYALKVNKLITLTPIAPKTARKRKTNKLNQKRLESFYKRKGFKEKEFNLKGTMIFEP